MIIRFIFIWVSLFGYCLNLMAQEYIWPTDASKFLTSSFAEYRSGHFHAGIDIKTWGQEGYKVFAIRDGYIWRIAVSPFGYGKVLYQKLNSGEIIVYAHLQKFNEQIEKIVKQEQKRQGEYRINKYFGANDIPVLQGEVIGYTGSSGIGYPHLHFEMRDTHNRPTNPFLFGYQISDTIPPKISAISITPLNAKSMVNSDVKSLILYPAIVATGKYQIKNQILLSGDIGFAVSCYDQANGVENKFAAYQLAFYVNNELKFSSVYDKFSYGETHLIELDRDFRLMKRDVGSFQKLYQEKENTLSFYKPLGREAGIVRCFLPEKNDSTLQNQNIHDFRIQIMDFNGNQTTLTGNFIIGKQKQLYSTVETDDENKVCLTNIMDEKGNRIQNPKFYLSADKGRSWKRALPPPLQNFEESTDDGYVFKANSSLQILKIIAEDERGLPTLPAFVPLVPDEVISAPPIDIQIEKDFYDDFIRLEIIINEIHEDMPIVLVQQTGTLRSRINLTRKDLNRYYGVYQLLPGKDGPLNIEVFGNDLLDKEFIVWDQFDITTITPQSGGKMASKDDDCRIVFTPDAVYRNLFLRMSEVSLIDTNQYEFVGQAYDIEPQDVPLKQRATVYLNYPQTDPSPAKLGVYGSYDGKKWYFNGDRLDRESNTIATTISDLRFVTLIRDTIPPEINILSPPQTVQHQFPTIRATVRDRLSGIGSERSIVIKLDEQKVIAEYDPEEHTITYEAEVPLAVGKHTVEVWAIDNSKNENRKRYAFSIVGN